MEDPTNSRYPGFVRNTTPGVHRVENQTNQQHLSCPLVDNGNKSTRGLRHERWGGFLHDGGAGVRPLPDGCDGTAVVLRDQRPPKPYGRGR